MKRILPIILALIIAFYPAVSFVNSASAATTSAKTAVVKTVKKAPVKKKVVKKPAVKKKSSKSVSDLLNKLPPIKPVARAPLIAPSPTKASSPASPSTVVSNPTADPYSLTINGILHATNQARASNGGIAPLKSSSVLDRVARARLEDMFYKQYFAHVSPSGVQPADVASKHGYKFISFGENLALDNYDGDQDVVNAWMNSDGHRANILSGKYSEIGIAVGKGNYQGSEVWIAVQAFGRSSLTCSPPDLALRDKIDYNSGKIADIQSNANGVKKYLTNFQPANQTEADAYNKRVNEYNGYIYELSALSSETSILITAYNSQVKQYGACVGN